MTATWFPHLLIAEQEKDLVQQVEEGYAIWDCAAVAYIIEPGGQDFQGLFDRGFKKFSAILSADDFSVSQLYGKRGRIVRLAIAAQVGPTNDFKLGVAWEGVASQVGERVAPKGNYSSSSELKVARLAIAMEEFEALECAALLE